MKIFKRILVVVLLFGLSVTAEAQSLPVPEPPSLGADSYILLDVQSGQVLASKNPHKHILPASVTKLMTCYIVFEALKNSDLSPDDVITVSEKAWKAHGSQMFLEVGDKVSIDTLLDGLVTASGNDAAIALAQAVAGTTRAFVSRMNAYADRLGLKDSHFENVDGLPVENHYMSVLGIAELQAEIIQEFPKLYHHYFSEKVFKYNGIKQYNRNKLLWSDARVDGGKTGHTKAAGYNLVVSAKDDGMRLVSAVTGTESDTARTRQAEALLNYGFRFFRNDAFVEAGQKVAEVKVWKGAADSVPVTTSGKVVISYPRGKHDAVQASARLPESLTAPIEKGRKIGRLTFKYNNEILKSMPLYTGKKVAEGGFFSQLVDSIWMMF